ncbi:hypothetical protein HDU76_013214 [Blyttiomyces sp. JEL0837]|nr:hypothetical protein HDU76_013214 [Blyttiomyces sp. JEL0837]
MQISSGHPDHHHRNNITDDPSTSEGTSTDSSSLKESADEYTDSDSEVDDDRFGNRKAHDHQRDSPRLYGANAIHESSTVSAKRQSHSSLPRRNPQRAAADQDRSWSDDGNRSADVEMKDRDYPTRGPPQHIQHDLNDGAGSKSQGQQMMDGSMADSAGADWIDSAGTSMGTDNKRSIFQDVDYTSTGANRQGGDGDYARRSAETPGLQLGVSEAGKMKAKLQQMSDDDPFLLEVMNMTAMHYNMNQSKEKGAKSLQRLSTGGFGGDSIMAGPSMSSSNPPLSRSSILQPSIGTPLLGTVNNAGNQSRTSVNSASSSSKSISIRQSVADTPGLGVPHHGSGTINEEEEVSATGAQTGGMEIARSSFSQPEESQATPGDEMRLSTGDGTGSQNFSTATLRRSQVMKANLEAKYSHLQFIEQSAAQGAVTKKDRRPARYNPIAVIRWRRVVWQRAIKSKTPATDVRKLRMRQYTWQVGVSEMIDYFKDEIEMPEAVRSKEEAAGGDTVMQDQQGVSLQRNNSGGMAVGRASLNEDGTRGVWVNADSKRDEKLAVPGADNALMAMTRTFSGRSGSLRSKENKKLRLRLGSTERNPGVVEEDLIGDNGDRLALSDTGDMGVDDQEVPGVGEQKQKQKPLRLLTKGNTLSLFLKDKVGRSTGGKPDSKPPKRTRDGIFSSKKNAASANAAVDIDSDENENLEDEMLVDEFNLFERFLEGNLVVADTDEDAGDDVDGTMDEEDDEDLDDDMNVDDSADNEGSQDATSPQEVSPLGNKTYRIPLRSESPDKLDVDSSEQLVPECHVEMNTLKSEADGASPNGRELDEQVHPRDRVSLAVPNETKRVSSERSRPPDNVTNSLPSPTDESAEHTVAKRASLVGTGAGGLGFLEPLRQFVRDLKPTDGQTQQQLESGGGDVPTSKSEIDKSASATFGGVATGGDSIGKRAVKGRAKRAMTLSTLVSDMNFMKSPSNTAPKEDLSPNSDGPDALTVPSPTDAEAGYESGYGDGVRSGLMAGVDSFKRKLLSGRVDRDNIDGDATNVKKTISRPSRSPSKRTGGGMGAEDVGDDVGKLNPIGRRGSRGFNIFKPEGDPAAMEGVEANSDVEVIMSDKEFASTPAKSKKRKGGLMKGVMPIPMMRGKDRGNRNGTEEGNAVGVVDVIARDGRPGARQRRPERALSDPETHEPLFSDDDMNALTMVPRPIMGAGSFYVTPPNMSPRRKSEVKEEKKHQRIVKSLAKKVKMPKLSKSRKKSLDAMKGGQGLVDTENEDSELEEKMPTKSYFESYKEKKLPSTESDIKITMDMASDGEPKAPTKKKDSKSSGDSRQKRRTSPLRRQSNDSEPTTFLRASESERYLRASPFEDSEVSDSILSRKKKVSTPTPSYNLTRIPAREYSAGAKSVQTTDELFSGGEELDEFEIIKNRLAPSSSRKDQLEFMLEEFTKRLQYRLEVCVVKMDVEAKWAKEQLDEWVNMAREMQVDVSDILELDALAVEDIASVKAELGGLGKEEMNTLGIFPKVGTESSFTSLRLLTPYLEDQIKSVETMREAVVATTKKIRVVSDGLSRGDKEIQEMVTQLDDLAVEVNQSWSRRLKVLEDRIYHESIRRGDFRTMATEFGYQALAVLLTVAAFIFWGIYQVFKVGRFVNSTITSSVKYLIAARARQVNQLPVSATPTNTEQPSGEDHVTADSGSRPESKIAEVKDSER